MFPNILKQCHHHQFHYNPTQNLNAKTLFTSLIHTLSNPNQNEFHESKWKNEQQQQQEQNSVFEISHPWPEWVDLMECLLKKGHFHAEGNPFFNPNLSKKGPLVQKDSNLIRTACLNFGRDNSHFLRFLSRKDIGVIVTFGCPSLDRKVVNSGKRLRAHVGIDEGNVCSSCNLRGDCERAFVIAREDEGGRMVDVMRIILTYGLDPIIGSVDNKPSLNKMVKESVRRLLKKIVECSAEEKNPNFPDTNEVAVEDVHRNPQDKGKKDVPMKQGDWLCPNCNFHNFARNIKCLHCDNFCEEKIKQLKEDNNHLPLKKGDWICDKCNFLNFARNTRCVLCKEGPSNRRINPGEWACESCNYINFRRNMVCLKCDHRRPKVSNASNDSLQPQGEDGKMNIPRYRFDDSNKDSSMTSERKSRKRDSHKWKFVEDGTENHKYLENSNDTSEVLDFPIAGGKTGMFEAQRGKAYMNELPDPCRKHLWQSETNDEFSSSDNLSTDDEEMAEWFGKGKNAR